MRQVSLKKERSEGNTTAIFKYSKEEWLVLLSSTTRKKGNMLQETTFQFIIKKNFLAFLACNSVYYSSDLKKKKCPLLHWINRSIWYHYVTGMQWKEFYISKMVALEYFSILCF